MLSVHPSPLPHAVVISVSVLVFLNTLHLVLTEVSVSFGFSAVYRPFVLNTF